MTYEVKEDFILENGTLYDPVLDKKNQASILISKGVVKKVGNFSSNLIYW